MQQVSPPSGWMSLAVSLNLWRGLSDIWHTCYKPTRHGPRIINVLFFGPNLVFPSRSSGEVFTVSVLTKVTVSACDVLSKTPPYLLSSRVFFVGSAGLAPLGIHNSVAPCLICLSTGSRSRVLFILYRLRRSANALEDALLIRTTGSKLGLFDPCIAPNSINTWPITSTFLGNIRTS
jgi:hypothetical protein